MHWGAMDIDFASLEPNNDFLKEVAPNVWLMDNHKWALYAWEAHCRASGVGRFVLVHADYHWDGVDEFFERPDAESRLLAADLAELLTMIRDEDGIQYDSFIAPAVRRGLIEELHFFCTQDDSDPGIDEHLRVSGRIKQFIHEDVNELAALTIDAPLIFDLCLDLFNESDYMDEGDIWPDAEVAAFMDVVRNLVTKANLVTVSLSFGCSGTREDTRRLASIVLPRIVAWRDHGP